MTGFYYLLTIITACIHLLVALYLLSLLVMVFIRNIPSWYVVVQSFILGIAGIFHVTSGVCPLTFAENYLRTAAGLPTYQGNFLNHYAETLFHFSIPSRLVSNAIILLAVLFCIVVARKVRLSRQQSFFSSQKS